MVREKPAATNAKRAAVKKARWYAVMSGEEEPPLACVDPTPISTVERMATPVALPTWRMVLKNVDARPIDSGVILAKEAAWLGTMIWAIMNPSANISARMSHRFVLTVICVRISRHSTRPTRPPVTCRRGPMRG